MGGGQHSALSQLPLKAVWLKVYIYAAEGVCIQKIKIHSCLFRTLGHKTVYKCHLQCQ